MMTWLMQMLHVMWLRDKRTMVGTSLSEPATVRNPQQTMHGQSKVHVCY